MKTAAPAASSSKFARYAAASAAALGSTAAAEAQFTAAYSLTPPAASTFNNPASASTFGQWTLTEYSSNLDETTTVTTSSGASLFLYSAVGASGTTVTLEFSAIAADDGNVTFDYSTFFAGSGHSFRFYTQTGGNLLNIFGAASASGATYAVAKDETFGFRVTAAYIGGAYMGATITNFSAPAAAVPEPGTAGLLAGCAALGFVGLVGVRRSRQRAA